jgi:hypothetical protein
MRTSNDSTAVDSRHSSGRGHQPLTWTDAKWADGRKVYEFLAARGVIERLSMAGTEMSGLGPHALALREVVYKWKQGGRASLFKVDEVLVQFDMHLSELPDDVWCSPGAPTPHASGKSS